MTDKGCCTNPDCSGDVPKNMCIDVREALKKHVLALPVRLRQVLQGIPHQGDVQDVRKAYGDQV